MKSFALQMYSLDGKVNADNLKEVFSAIRKFGFNAVELYTDYGLTAEKISEYANNAKLKIIGYHANAEEFDDFDKIIEFVSKLGAEFLIYSYSNVKSVEDAVKLGKHLEILSVKTAMKGLRFCYHNHDTEFGKTEDEGYFFDTIVDNAGAICEFEFDIGWAKYAGADPYDLMRKYAGKMPLVHLRQLNSENKFIPLCDGEVDMPSVKSLGEIFGTEYYIAELEPDENWLDNISQTADYLKKL